jgi:hypothetical protein
MPSLRDYFVAPVEEAQRPEALGPIDPTARHERRFGRRRPARVPATTSSALAPSLGLLVAGRDLPAVAVAAGVVIGRRAPAALVCVHAAGAQHAAPLRAPARRAAARLAAALAARGLPADAWGRVVLVRSERGETSRRALATAAALPSVLAAGVREPEVDALLAERDAILVALSPSSESTLGDLALVGANELTASATAVQVTFDPVSRALALGGLRAPRRLHDAVEGLLG